MRIPVVTDHYKMLGLKRAGSWYLEEARASMLARPTLIRRILQALGF